MGLYIKGLRLPKKGRYTSFTVYSGGRVVYKFGGNPAGQAVEVPPHGRLIDASEKIQVRMYDDMTEDYFSAEMTIDDLFSHKDWVEADVPTIIPAEEET